MGNLDLWNAHADIDPKFTKPITGKAYKGTSPSPQHVIYCLTDLFGPVGEGFGWDIVAEGFQPIGDEILHWCRVKFWHGDRQNSFDSYGQTKALMKTRNGMMSDEDAPKKSLTDAIVKAASHIGIAANIFLGRWDDQKYVQQVADSFAQCEKPARDADAITESLIAAVNKRDTYGKLKDLLAHKQFADPLAWLKEEHSGHAKTVAKAIEAARKRVSPAAQDWEAA